MEEILYLCVRLVCISYLLYIVYGWKKQIEKLCRFFYGKPTVKKEKKEVAVTESAVSDAEVMGSTRYVYLDENAGKTAAPFMSQPLERFVSECRTGLLPDSYTATGVYNFLSGRRKGI